EGPAQVGSHSVIDVYSDLYKSVNDTTQNDTTKNTGTGKSNVHFMDERWREEKEEAERKMKPGEEAVIPDKASKGWQADAHKNLPGFRVLGERFPDAEWYFMVDDDTYLVLPNLLPYLSNLDPTLPHYIGSPNFFTGCDNVRKMGEGPLFAQGGSGILLSRAALKILTNPTHIQTCIEKYKSCWAGDVRVALCLRDAGVMLTREYGFNGDPPGRNFRWHKNACGKPLGFHHLLTSQVQRLHQVVASSPSTPITYSDIFKHFKPSLHLPDAEHEDVDTNRPGDDYKNVESGSSGECKQICRAEERCLSWVWEEGRCWLKDGVPGPKEKKGSVSGVFWERYGCRE
ncbi:hypothetical protein HK097_004371, partial [Rhizophlyctis rosea]